MGNDHTTGAGSWRSRSSLKPHNWARFRDMLKHVFWLRKATRLSVGWWVYALKPIRKSFLHRVKETKQRWWQRLLYPPRSWFRCWLALPSNGVASNEKISLFEPKFRVELAPQQKVKNLLLGNNHEQATSVSSSRGWCPSPSHFPSLVADVARVGICCNLRLCNWIGYARVALFDCTTKWAAEPLKPKIVNIIMDKKSNGKQVVSHEIHTKSLSGSNNVDKAVQPLNT